MSETTGNSLEDTLTLLGELPGIGRKSAARILFYLLRVDPGKSRRLGEALATLRERIKSCRECGNYSEAEICPICASDRRRKEVICVVEQSQDLYTIEATGSFHGLYHVLQGVLSPIDGIGPKELRLDTLSERVERFGVNEVIVATNPTLEGDSTALYIKQMLEPGGVTVSRIASGLPVGGDFEYADRLSIQRSFEGRRALT